MKEKTHQVRARNMLLPVTVGELKLLHIKDSLLHASYFKLNYSQMFNFYFANSIINMKSYSYFFILFTDLFSIEDFHR